MKPSRLFFVAALVPIDYGALLIAAFLTYFVRFNAFQSIRPAIFTIPFEEFIRIVLVVSLGWLVIFATNGLYSIGRRKFTEEFAKIIFGCATGFVAILFYLVFKQELFTSRFILLVTFFLAIIFVTAGRIIIRLLERLLLSQGIGAMQIILIGKSGMRLVFTDEFFKKPGLGYKVVKEFGNLDSFSADEIKEMHKKGLVDGIFMTDPNISHEEAVLAANLADDFHLRFFYSADLFSAISANRSIHTFAGAPVIETKKTKLDGWGAIAKRIFDIVISLMLLIIVSPAFLIIAIGVLIETGRPIVFRNERVGARGKIFDTLKFRSMRQKDCIGKQFSDHEHESRAYEAELIREKSIKQGPVYKIKDDPRVTPFGKFLRRWSLDELPQLWNVFRGDMSLVGPRPHQPREVEQYARHHRHVLAIKPGITGIAQISGRSDLDFEEEVRLDTYYVENWSLALDLFIAAKTPFVVLLRRGVY